MQERRNSIAKALELRLSCTYPAIHWPSFLRKILDPAPYIHWCMCIMNQDIDHSVWMCSLYPFKDPTRMYTSIYLFVNFSFEMVTVWGGKGGLDLLAPGFNPLPRPFYSSLTRPFSFFGGYPPCPNFCPPPSFASRPLDPPPHTHTHTHTFRQNPPYLRPANPWVLIHPVTLSSSTTVPNGYSWTSVEVFKDNIYIYVCVCVCAMYISSCIWKVIRVLFQVSSVCNDSVSFYYRSDDGIQKSNYHCCWCSGSFRRQGISRHVTIYVKKQLCPHFGSYKHQLSHLHFIMFLIGAHNQCLLIANGRYWKAYDEIWITYITMSIQHFDFD